MMLGYLLAHGGVDVTVLEKHGDFLRDFRGDTVHPSTMQVMHELGLLDEFLKRPHQEIREAEGEIGDVHVKIADLTHLPTAAKFIALMPQWDFLDFLAEKARAFPNFRLIMDAEALALFAEDGKVAGLKVRTANGEQSMRASLVVGCDGRHSVLRDRSGLAVRDLGAPIDVLWMRLKHRRGDGESVLGHIDAGSIFVMLYRGDYWQCALVIDKGGIEAVKAKGIEAFRARVAALAGRDNADEIESWDDVKLLTVAVDRLEKWWKPGLLFIGDAAHAMSPVGGVGINLAIQDAVAAANILWRPLKEGALSNGDLAAVQKRRMFPTRMTQGFQVAIQNNIIKSVLASGTAPRVPFAIRLLQWFPLLRRIPARVLGLGIRPEHVSRALR